MISTLYLGTKAVVDIVGNFDFNQARLYSDVATPTDINELTRKDYVDLVRTDMDASVLAQKTRIDGIMDSTDNVALDSLKELAEFSKLLTDQNKNEYTSLILTLENKHVTELQTEETARLALDAKLVVEKADADVARTAAKVVADQLRNDRDAALVVAKTVADAERTADVLAFTTETARGVAMEVQIAQETATEVARVNQKFVDGENALATHTSVEQLARITEDESIKLTMASNKTTEEVARALADSALGVRVDVEKLFTQQERDAMTTKYDAERVAADVRILALETQLQTVFDYFFSTDRTVVPVREE
jgi:hypothetical protein